MLFIYFAFAQLSAQYMHSAGVKCSLVCFRTCSHDCERVQTRRTVKTKMCKPGFHMPKAKAFSFLQPCRILQKKKDIYKARRASADGSMASGMQARATSMRQEGNRKKTTTPCLFCWFPVYGLKSNLLRIFDLFFVFFDVFVRCWRESVCTGQRGALEEADGGGRVHLTSRRAEMSLTHSRHDASCESACRGEPHCLGPARRPRS